MKLSKPSALRLAIPVAAIAACAALEGTLSTTPGGSFSGIVVEGDAPAEGRVRQAGHASGGPFGHASHGHRAPGAQAPAYRFVAPDLVAQGESFTGTVVEVTPQGEKPIGPGATVVMNGEVVAQSEGRVTVPRFNGEVGNYFLFLLVTTQFDRPGGQRETSTQRVEPAHVEIVPPRTEWQSLPKDPRIEDASDVATGGNRYSVYGDNLTSLKNAALRSADGAKTALGEPLAASRYQAIYSTPGSLPKGTHTFEAEDAAGKVYKSPEPCYNPAIALSGPQIVRVGQRGDFTVSIDPSSVPTEAAGKVFAISVTGGGAQLSLGANETEASVRKPGSIPFEATQLGQYTLNAVVRNPEELPPRPNAPEVDAKPGTPTVKYDARANQTEVSCPAAITDAKGKPVADVPVRGAIVTPSGLTHARATSDRNGKATFLAKLAGRITAAAVSVHVSRVTRCPWKPPHEMCELKYDVKPGTGIAAKAIAPPDGETDLKEPEKLPLIVDGKDDDQVEQKCICHDEAKSTDVKMIDCVDSVNYTWKVLSGKGKVSPAAGPATLFEPPELKKGDTDTSVVEATIKDVRGNDAEAKVTFTIMHTKVEDCKYKRKVSKSVESTAGGKLTPTGQSAKCKVLPHKWRAVPTALNGDVPGELKLCVGERVVISGSGTDDDTLEMYCGGVCGYDDEKALMIDDTVYEWSADIGGFPDHGGNPTNSRATTAIYKAPDTPGEGKITVTIKDSGRQVNDAPVKKEIKVKVFKLDLEVKGVAEDDEECKGGFLCLNIDDDDRNSKIDRTHEDVQDEDDLIEIKITKEKKEGNVTLSVKQHGKGNVAVWEDKNKKKASPMKYPASELPKTLWVEGIASSEELKDVELILETDDVDCKDKARLTVLRVDLDVDADRDKTVDRDKDDTNEDKWEKGKGKRGAVILANADDDKEGGSKDNKPDNWPGGDLDGNGAADPPDSKVNGAEDLKDIGPLWLSKLDLKTLPDDLKVDVWIEKVPGEDAYFAPKAPNERVRIFYPTKVVGDNVELQDGDKEIIGPGNSGDGAVGAARAKMSFVKNPAGGDPGQRSFSVLAGEGIFKFGIEGIEYGAPVIAHVEVFVDGKSICKDTVQLRVAPWIAFTHKQDVDTGTPGGDHTAFVERLGGAGAAGNIELRANLNAKYPGHLDEATVGDDWHQDPYEIGYSQAPYAEMHVILGMARGALDGGKFNRYARRTLMRDGVALIAEFYLDVASWNNQTDGGNMEVQPKGKFGTIVCGENAGSGLGKMNPNIVKFVKAQDVQPIVDDVNLKWMYLGHFDEVVSFPSGVGDRSRVASPEAAWALLLIAKKFHAGGAVEFHDGMAGGKKKVDDVLGNAGLRSANFGVGGYSDKMQAIIAKLGLTPCAGKPATSRVGGPNLKRVGYLEGYAAAGTSESWRITFENATDFKVEIAQTRGVSHVWVADGKGKKTEDFVSDSKMLYFVKDWWTGGAAAKDDRITVIAGPSKDMAEFPVLFENKAAGRALAYTNNVVNSVVDGATIFVSRTFGPRVLGGATPDIFEWYVDTMCKRVGFTTVRFCEERIYHNGQGSVHCGSNVRRKMPSKTEDIWWNNP